MKCNLSQHQMLLADFESLSNYGVIAKLVMFVTAKSLTELISQITFLFARSCERCSNQASHLQTIPKQPLDSCGEHNCTVKNALGYLFNVWDQVETKGGNKTCDKDLINSFTSFTRQTIELPNWVTSCDSSKRSTKNNNSHLCEKEKPFLLKAESDHKMI